MSASAWVCAAALACVACPAHAQPARVGFDQHPGARLPLGARFVDDTGRHVSLGDAIGAGPTVLVLGYLACHDLCPMTLTGIEEALHASGLEAGRDYRALFVSVDPREAAILGDEKAARIPKAERGAWTFLAGEEGSIDALARSVGYRYQYEKDRDAYAHAAGFVVLTPAGTVSRYFFGVRFEPGEVADALRQAAGGGVGSLATRLVLLCYHFDPLTGRYTLAIVHILDAVIAIFLALAGLWAWRHRRMRRVRAAP